jgi:hypothetical protein
MLPLEIWSDPNYSGRSARLVYGWYRNAAAIGVPDNAISSLKIAPFTRVRLFDLPDFSGTTFNIIGPKEISFLGDYATSFDDRISSIIVERIEPTDTVKMDCCADGTAYTCGEFMPGSANCAVSTANYCTSHLWEPRCQTWCNNNSAACDASAVKYCDIYWNDPFCSCIKSTAAGVINPKCVDKKCLNTGYLTTAMKATNCPDIVNCSIKTILNNSGVVLSNVTPIQQNCGSNSTQPSAQPPTQSPPQPQPPSSSLPSLSQVPTSYYMIIFFIFMVFILIAIIIKKISIRSAM